MLQHCVLLSDEESRANGCNYSPILNSADMDPGPSDGIDYSQHFITEQIFDSYEDACHWCKEVAMTLHFEVFNASHKKNQGDGRLKVYVRCNRGDLRKTKDVGDDDDSVSTRNTYTKACRCKFLLKVVQRREDRKFVVKPLFGFHNHPLFVYSEGHRQMGRLTPPMKSKIHEMASNHTKSGKILNAILKEYPDNSPTIKQVYNERHKKKMEDRDGRNVVEHVAHMAKKDNYVLFMEPDEDTDRLKHVFAAHPDSVRLLCTYPHVILIDCTYKTNRYRLPMCEIIGVSPTNNTFLIAFALIKDETAGSYMWVMRSLRHLIGDTDSHAIITDRELGLLNPIAYVFPNSAHLLCTWHIRKDVLSKVYNLFGKNKRETIGFARGPWENVMTVSSEDQYVAAVQAMCDAYCHKSFMLKYVQSTWLVHKEKFVSCWTNRVRHFGNTTTNRVESQHALVKYWLETGRGALDTLFDSVDACIRVQLVKIRQALEESRVKMPVDYANLKDFPLQQFVFKVSLHCLTLVMKEEERIKKKSIACGCVFRSTHGLPCACEIRSSMRDKTPIDVDSIDTFWTTLLIYGDGPQNPQTAEKGNGYEPDEQQHEQADEDNTVYQEFQHVVSQVSESGWAKMRRATYLLKRELFPGHGEPDVKMNVKGRPKGSTSTRREPSAFEYTESRGRGRGRGRARSSSSKSESRPDSQASRPSPQSSRPSTQSSDSVNDFQDLLDTDISRFSYGPAIPTFLMDYWTGWFNPKADGNCGFRCLASALLGSQERWPIVREMLKNEVQANRHIYAHVYGRDEVDAAIQRIHWTGSWCDASHWMEVPADLFPAAKCFNCAIMLYSPLQCLTILPWSATSSSNGPAYEIGIALNHCHYVRVQFRHSYPVPPICSPWSSIHDSTVEGWNELFTDRVQMFNRLKSMSM